VSVNMSDLPWESGWAASRSTVVLRQHSHARLSHGPTASLVLPAAVGYWSGELSSIRLLMNTGTQHAVAIAFPVENQLHFTGITDAGSKSFQNPFHNGQQTLSGVDASHSLCVQLLQLARAEYTLKCV